MNIAVYGFAKGPGAATFIITATTQPGSSPAGVSPLSLALCLILQTRSICLDKLTDGTRQTGDQIREGEFAVFQFVVPPNVFNLRAVVTSSAGYADLYIGAFMKLPDFRLVTVF